MAKPFIVSGSIKSIGSKEAPDKILVVRDKKGNIQVKLSPSTTIEIHKITTIGDLDGGATIHLLARKQAEQLGTGGARYPPMLVQIQCIVTGSFKPSKIPSKLASQGLVWVSGTLKSVENGREREVGEYRLGTALGSEVLQIEHKNTKVLKKRQKIFLAGYLDDSDRKNRSMEATEILILDPRWKKYPATHDLPSRKPAARKKEGEDPPKEDDLPF
ncbi:MAG: hypothetical protein OSB09_11945 [Planctomycetota bacterium]|nr:hypothetical protein [Planctomycetota bacterium]